jgi:hypothetical protein
MVSIALPAMAKRCVVFAGAGAMVLAGTVWLVRHG